MRRAIASIGLILSSACGGETPLPPTVRLVDEFRTAVVEGQISSPGEVPRTEWRFDARESPWRAGVGIEGLTLRDARLSGRTTTDFPILHAERSVPAGSDLVHAVEVRARVSKGANLRVTFLGEGRLDLGGVVAEGRRLPWPLATPVIAGDEFHTYTMTAAGAALTPRTPSFAASDIHHVLIRPSDEAGAEFEIESVRLIFRKEHLASIPSGVGWHGFEDIFRETLVLRSPETALFDLTLSERPLFDLAIGTLEESPVTFRVEIDGERVFERTVTTPHRWEPASFDLEKLGGRKVGLRLSVTSESDGGLGFWGSPSIRNRGARPRRAAASRVDFDPPPGVILFLADTLRRDHLDSYGYERPTAPVLKRVASEGTLFMDDQSQASWTKVSIPSILSSLYPTTHGVRQMSDRLPASATTLAEVYRQAGYATMSFASIAFSGRGTNLHQGFEELHERGSLVLPAGQSASKTARSFNDRLLPWLREHRDVPFFVLVHVMDPHPPLEPYRPYDTLWGPPDGRAQHRVRTEKVNPFIKNPFFRQRGLPKREELDEAGVAAGAFVDQELDWYDGSIRAMDVELGRLLEALDELEIADETLLAFISDHGTEFLERGYHWHGRTVYGEITNVPLVLWGPGRIPPGTIVRETVQSIDLMPTLLEMSHLPIPEGAQGQSLVPLLLGSGEWRKRPAFQEVQFADEGPAEAADSRAVVAEGFKLIHNLLGLPGIPEWELFDHVKDPWNRVNIAAEKPEIVKRLSILLEDWHKFAEAARLPSNEKAIEGMDSDELERLRSLGYVQ
jgi:arylsulfatase A-like enzyme